MSEIERTDWRLAAATAEIAQLRQQLADLQSTIDLQQSTINTDLRTICGWRDRALDAEQRAEELATINQDWMAQTNEALSRAEVAEQALAKAKQEAERCRKLWLGLQSRLDFECYEHAQERLTVLLDVEKALATEQARAQELRRVLSAVEWRPALDNYEHCPYCGRTRIHGHGAGCQLQAALTTDAGQTEERQQVQAAAVALYVEDAKRRQATGEYPPGAVRPPTDEQLEPFIKQVSEEKGRHQA